jgi:hypothetical protein
MTRQRRQTAATPSIQMRRVQTAAAAAGSAVSTLTHYRLGGHRVMLWWNLYTGQSLKLWWNLYTEQSLKRWLCCWTIGLQ